MQGNQDLPPAALSEAATAPPPAIDYAVRLTFGVVHATLLTLFSFALAFLVPSFSHFLFSLFGCILAPLLSLLLAAFCNACVEYVSTSTLTWKRILKGAWLPALGVFGVSLLILPLEMMPQLGFRGPVNTLVVTSIVANFIVTALLQVYVAKEIQTQGQAQASPSSVSDAGSDGRSGPI
jgi:hypothetical protein